ncbi:hypothetical protein JXR01_00725 [Candidatus Kaiserbacteria bacterium]|nr:MAG: hypothetical protein JXR01_00725 [Candidatus Kaiserbacteria bacterium]
MRYKLVGFVLFLLAVGVLGFFLFQNSLETVVEPEVKDTLGVPVTIGTSVEGRAIDAYTYGEGETHLLFVGGIHGGYEWNSVLLAYTFIDYLNANAHTVPEDITISVIPALNPDGLFDVIGKEGRFTPSDISVDTTNGTGRFNAQGVDLNRNFDCKWQPESTWRNKPVGAGTEPFSEPEATAIRDLVTNRKIDAVVFWHSQSNAVYASECEEGVLPATIAIMNAYSDAAGYKAIESFDAYPITGDAEGWLASIGVPAITVELKTHETIEWKENLAGVRALLSYFSEVENSLTK